MKELWVSIRVKPTMTTFLSFGSIFGICGRTTFESS